MTSFDKLSLKIPLILATLIFMSSLSFMLSRVELKKSSITLGAGVTFTSLLSYKLSKYLRTNEAFIVD